MLNLRVSKDIRINNIMIISEWKTKSQHIVYNPCQSASR